MNPKVGSDTPVLVLVSSYGRPMTGAQVRFDRLAKYLSSKNCRLIWLSPRRRDIGFGDQVEFLNAGEKSASMPTSVWMSWAVARHAKQLFGLRHSRPLFITFGESNLIPCFLAALIAHGQLSVGIRGNIKLRLKINQDQKYPPFVTSAALHIWGFIYRRAAQVTVQTPLALVATANDFGVQRAKIDVIENDLPLARTRGIQRCTTDHVARRLLFVGDDTKVKGLDVLVNAMTRIPLVAPQIKVLTVVGPSESAVSVLRIVSKTANIEVIRIDSTKNIIEIMAKSDLLVVPSREDQFPNVVLEAMAIGLPVIGSDIDGINHILSDRRLLFEAGNSDRLLDAIAWMSSPDCYMQAIQIIRERAEHFRFNWEERYWKLLTPVLQRNWN